MAFTSTGSSQLAASPNITPLTDVLLVLLIIFMVITPQASQGLGSLLPTSRSAPESSSAELPLVVHAFSVKSGPSPVVRYRVADQEAVDRAGLRQRLRAWHALHPASTLFVTADPGLSYSAVMAVLDEAHQQGLTHLGLLPRKR